MKHKYIVFILMGFIFMAGCAKRTTIPEIDVSRLDAERSIAMAQSEIDEAKKVGADVGVPEIILGNAKKLLEEENFLKAKNEADKAGNLARRLKQELLAKIRSSEDARLAIERAEKLIAMANSEGCDVTEPEGILKSAKKEFDNAHYNSAVKLADEAYKLTQKILKLFKMDKYVVGTWSIDRDCLWNIAKKKGIYNDPWKWKRIYMANRDKIKNPDLIYPKQILKIPRD